MVSDHSNSTSSLSTRIPLFYRILLILLFVSQVTIAQRTTKQSVGPAGGDIEISPLELRVTMNDFFYRFARTITASADSIMRFSSNHTIDNEALIWKMNAIPIANGAIYNSDPFLGYIDIAVFTYQLKLYFETGAGKDLFGDHQDIALRALDSLWEELLVIGRNLVPDNDISDGTKVVMEFAEQNPITSSYFIRQSTIPLMTKIQIVEKVTFKRLAEGMSQSLDELSSQISSYVEILPKQVRWETEYILNNTLSNPDLNLRFDSLVRLLERTVILVESSPELIDNQRKEAFMDISKERMAVIQAIRQERVIILDEFRNERTIVLEQIDELITNQREAAFQDLNALTNQSIIMTFNNLDEIIDKLFWRIVVMISILLVLIFIGFIFYKKI